jgi:hypothetical protein
MITKTRSEYNSSTVKAAAYDAEDKTLTVHFNHASYLYKDVELTDWDLFNTADSQGKALNEFIKPKYEFERTAIEG